MYVVISLFTQKSLFVKSSGVFKMVFFEEFSHGVEHVMCDYSAHADRFVT